MKSHSKKYTLTNLDFNQVCFIQQSIKARIEHYQDKLVKNPKDKTYIKAVKDLTNLLNLVTELKKSKGEKMKASFDFLDQKDFDRLSK